MTNQREKGLLFLKDFIHSVFKRNNELRKNILFLFSGNGIAQALPILAYPLLTRLFLPEEFGFFGIYLSIFSILAVVLNMRLEMAIPLAADKNELSYLVKTSVLIGIVISSIFILCSLLIRGIFLSASDELYFWLPILGANLLICSVLSPLKYLAVYHKLFKHISVYEASLSFVTIFLRIAFGYLKTPYNGLVLAHSISTAFCTIGFVFIIRRVLPDIIKTDYSMNRIRTILKKYKDFPLFNSLHALTNTLASSFPYLVLSYFYGKDIAGYYTLSAGILLKPVKLVGNSLNAVFYQKHAENLRTKTPSMVFFKKTTRLLFIFTLPVFIGLLFLNPTFFGTLLGKDWNNISTTFRILIPWVFMVFITSPISFAPDSTGHQKKNMIYNLVYSLLRILALFFGVAFSNYMISLSLYSLVGTFFLIFYLFWYKHLFLLSDKQIS
jgi:O-antigen/teichoic acid export membrane protein